MIMYNLIDNHIQFFYNDYSLLFLGDDLIGRKNIKFTKKIKRTTF